MRILGLFSLSSELVFIYTRKSEFSNGLSNRRQIPELRVTKIEQSIRTDVICLHNQYNRESRFNSRNIFCLHIATLYGNIFVDISQANCWSIPLSVSLHCPSSSRS